MSRRASTVVGLIGAIAVVSVAWVAIRPSGALWLVLVGVGLEVVVSRWAAGDDYRRDRGAATRAGWRAGLYV